jgi:hypothetical protein
MKESAGKNKNKAGQRGVLKVVLEATFRRLKRSGIRPGAYQRASH